MTTTGTDALKKRLARALYVSWWTDHMQDPSASYDHPLNEDAREACESAADALLPIVAEEVLAAQEKTWDRAYWQGVQDEIDSQGFDGGMTGPSRINPYSEIGDSDDHRP